MLTTPRIIAIDDDLRHLAGLTKSLNRHGIACLQIHTTGDPSGIKPCPGVRIIFADLHLGTGSPSDHASDFSTIGGLLETAIKPTGPYFIVLWTRYPDQASELQRFLEERLQDVERPFDVLPLAKAKHLDDIGEVRNEDALVNEIVRITEALPQLGALFSWESRVLEAAGDTVSSILKLTAMQETQQRAEEVGGILASLGTAAVGEAHARREQFRAVNEALLPILADRIANLSSRTDDDAVWREAVAVDGGAELTLSRAARLNRLAHIADVGSDAAISERGVVVALPRFFEDDFRAVFDIDEDSAADRQFRCRDFRRGDGECRWVLVQCQAACDHAQSQPGPTPCYLGLDFPEPRLSRRGKPPASVWTSPAFEFNGTVRVLRVNARFCVGLASDVAQSATRLYRIREQMLNDLIYHVHSHGARPGMMSFRP